MAAREYEDDDREGADADGIRSSNSDQNRDKQVIEMCLQVEDCLSRDPSINMNRVKLTKPGKDVVEQEVNIVRKGNVKERFRFIKKRLSIAPNLNKGFISATVNLFIILIILACEMDTLGFVMSAYSNFGASLMNNILFIAMPLAYTVAILFYVNEPLLNCINNCLHGNESQRDRNLRSLAAEVESYNKIHMLGPNAQRDTRGRGLGSNSISDLKILEEPVQRNIDDNIVYLYTQEHVNQFSLIISNSNNVGGFNTDRPPLRIYHFFPLTRLFIFLFTPSREDINILLKVNTLSTFTLGVANLVALISKTFNKIPFNLMDQIAEKMLYGSALIVLVYFIQPLRILIEQNAQVEKHAAEVAIRRKKFEADLGSLLPRLGTEDGEKEWRKFVNNLNRELAVKSGMPPAYLEDFGTDGGEDGARDVFNAVLSVLAVSAAGSVGVDRAGESNWRKLLNICTKKGKGNRNNRGQNYDSLCIVTIADTVKREHDQKTSRILYFDGGAGIKRRTSRTRRGLQDITENTDDDSSINSNLDTIDDVEHGWNNIPGLN